MAKRCFTGWRTVEPGECFHCGFDDRYGCDGRGVVMCECQVDEDECVDAATFDFGEAEVTS